MSVEVFEARRGRLMAIAYGMLGSVADAEDVVQDAWLRWSAVDASSVDQPDAYLTTVVTRLAIDRLRSARRRRETYVGPWLPEPIITEVDDDPADVVAEAEQLSMALLFALERLNPVERAVLLLRDVFDLDYVEVAAIVDRSPSNCRQIAARSRAKVGDPHRVAPGPRDDDRKLVEAFMVAAASGDLDRLISLLAADVVAWSDGGDRRRAARHPISGADRVARFISKVTHDALDRGVSGRVVRANGSFAFLGTRRNDVYAVVIFEIRDGQVTALRSILNPDKLPSSRPR